MLIPQYLVLVLKLTPINTVSLNTIFSIPQNQCYPGNPCNLKSFENSRPSASNFESFSRSLEQIFLKVGRHFFRIDTLDYEKKLHFLIF